MKTLIGGFLSLILFLYISITPVFANHLPPPTGYVNDFANVLTTDQKSELENNLRDYKNKTTNEITVAIIKSLDGNDITDFTVKAFEEWKIGVKGKDNGILLLIALQDRKMRIEVGYGLEPKLTDAIAGDIIRQDIAPQFQQSNYYQGVKDGITAIEKQIDGKGIDTSAINITDNRSQNFQSPSDIFTAFFWFIIIMNAVIYFLSYLARGKKGLFAGAIVGITAGIIYGFLSSSLIIGLFSSFILGVIGILLDIHLTHVHQHLKAQGKSTGFWATAGGFSTGGGFGGFGGGSSGGGGASGGW